MGTGLTDAVATTLPVVAANAEQAERERCVPPENVDLLYEAGFLRAFQPARFGGGEVGADEYASAVADIAGACPSTATY